MTAQIALLVVEDEPLIRLGIEDALVAGGFAVQSASNAAEAIALIDDPAFGAAGLVTDINLGAGVGGWELARRARERDATICVVYVTADSAAVWPAEGVPKSVVLQKPFADAQLVTAISMLMNERAGVAASAS